MILNFKSLLKSKPFLYASGSAVVVALGVGGIVLLGSNHNNAKIDACNTGNDDKACEYVLSLNPEDYYKSKLNSAVLKARDERKAAAVKAEAERDERIAAYEAAAVKRKAEYAKAASEERAKFAAEGWWEAEKGIFIRWCGDNNPCPGNAKSNSDYTWRAMVYCRDRACGDIYARLNILQDDVVVGWTNDSAYGDIRQKVVLTFGSSTQGSGRIVEFSARG